VSGSYFPQALGTLRADLADVRGAIDFYSPLPLSRRATATLGLRGRGLFHGERQQLLEVGGNLGGSLYEHPREESLTAYPGLPPKRRFQEPLRGFETLPFTADRIAIADLSLRYPIIIDRGTATSLWFMPSFFLRQVDGATDSFRALHNAGHLAGGGAIHVSFVWWVVPLSLGYQLSRRLTDDEARQHLLLLSFSLAP
jgi:hypothetical protein